MPGRTKDGEFRSLGFGEAQTPYESASQNARALSESWALGWLYCPNCGNNSIEQFENNRPVSDFYCAKCQEEYELKSKKGKFGAKVVDGAFGTMQERLASDTNPNFAFLSYNLAERRVVNLFVVPKQFVIPEIIEKRRPLSPSARRAGWVGCNIRLGELPQLGRIHMVREGVVQPKDSVIEQWQKSQFLKGSSADARGWLIEVMTCCEMLRKSEFELSDIYAFEAKLAAMYPDNRHVKQKIRQQLQVLRDGGYLEFLGRGRYRLR